MKLGQVKHTLFLAVINLVVVVFIVACVSQQPSHPEQAVGPRSPIIISRNVPAYSSSGTGSDANDDSLDTTWWSSTVSSGANAWLAYDLSSVPLAKRGRVLLVWYNETSSYDHTVINEAAYNMPGSYTIDLNFAPGGTTPPTSGWRTVVTVTNNHYHSRQHVFDMQGANWVRINVTASDGSADNYSVRINMDIYEASYGLENDFIDYGDSITAGSMSHLTTEAQVKSFGDLIHEQLPDQFLIEEDGGTGYLSSYNPIDSQHHYLQAWLSVFPGKYVGLSYGTDDSWGCGDPAGIADKVYNNYVDMVQTVLAAGKIPIVPHIIWSPRPDLRTCAIAINAKLDQLYKIYPKVIPGPDLFAVFQNHPEDFDDMIHPNDKGIGLYRQAWATMFLKSIYHWKGVSKTPTLAGAITSGEMFLNWPFAVALPPPSPARPGRLVLLHPLYTAD